jgi:hypothetical protein
MANHRFDYAAALSESIRSETMVSKLKNRVDWIFAANSAMTHPMAKFRKRGQTWDLQFE